MSIECPQVEYPEEDSPENGGFVLPEIEIVDYLKIVIPGLRKDNTVYALLPTSRRITGGLVASLPIVSITGWRNGSPTSMLPSWMISEERWEYPGWEVCDSSPFGNAPAPIIDISQSPVATVGYYPPYPEYTTIQMPDIIWKIFSIESLFKKYPDFENLFVTIFNQTNTETTFDIYKQTITDVTDIVILIPILAAFALPLVLSLIANVGNNTQTNDIRRRQKR